LKKCLWWDPYECDVADITTQLLSALTHTYKTIPPSLSPSLTQAHSLAHAVACLCSPSPRFSSTTLASSQSPTPTSPAATDCRQPCAMCPVLHHLPSCQNDQVSLTRLMRTSTQVIHPQLQISRFLVLVPLHTN
jgi:hypothetical protein